MMPVRATLRSSSALVPTVVPCTMVAMAPAPSAARPMPFEAARFLAARGRHLDHARLAGVLIEHEQVRERAAHVHAHHQGLLRRRHRHALPFPARRPRAHIAHIAVAPARRLAALRRRSVAAAARRFQPHAFAALERDAQHLRGHGRRQPLPVLLIAEHIRCRRLAAGHALGAAAAALAEDEGLGAVFQQFDFVDGAQAAAMPAVAGRVGPQRPLREAHRISGLQDLQRRNRRRGDRRVAVAQAVARAMAAVAAAEEAEHDPALPLARRVAAVAGDGQRVDGAVGLGRALGRGLATAQKITSIMRRMVSV